VAAATGQYFPVVVSLRNDGKLLAGMTARATLTLSASQGIIVPAAAVQDAEDGKAFVFAIAGGKATKRTVTLGVGGGRDVLVLSGLSEGENVAVSNVGALQDGMEVSQ
jgi:multidrug efflux pump subunit AcrA (membrane-fusion protein)